MIYNQYEVVLVNLDPTIGSEMKKTRPCIILSPNEMNHNISTIIIAPMISTGKNYPTRVKLDDDSFVVLDQIKTIDKQRVIKKLDNANKKDIEIIKSIIKQMLVD